MTVSVTLLQIEDWAQLLLLCSAAKQQLASSWVQLSSTTTHILWGHGSAGITVAPNGGRCNLVW
jgi:hypothetical protein